MKAVVIRSEPGTNELVHSEPRTSVMPPTMSDPKGSRRVEFIWEIGPGADELGEPVIECAVLSVYSHHPQRKYYTATLRREQMGKTFRSCKIELGKPAAWDDHLRSDRFKKAHLVEYAYIALGMLREAADVPTVQEVFGVSETPVVEVVEKPADTRTLDWLQGLVGGNIEPIQLDETRMEGYVNEEGKIERLPANDVATAFWFHTMSGEYGVQPGDYVAGPLVIVGPLDEEGDTTSVSDEVIAEVQAFAAAPVYVDRLAKEAESYLASVE